MYLYLRASVWETGGYFTEKELEKPSRDWTHLALAYYVIPSNRMTSFALYVNGVSALTDLTKIARDTAYGDGRIVLGRPYSELDNYYTSMEVDQVTFYNHASNPREIRNLYETGGVYPR